jgi:hypothetical protein
MVEAYSVLTRLPSGLAAAPADAAAVLERRFPEPPLRLEDTDRAALLQRLSGAGVFGGASYDGLVALEAAAHALTLDTRAQATYSASASSSGQSDEGEHMFV